MRSQKRLTLPILAVVFFGLIVLVGITRSNDAAVRSSTPTPLFSSLRGEDISKIVLAEGPASVELVEQDGEWRVPARSGYPAATDKIRSLLLKFIDLNVSQRVTSDPKQFARLGVAPESVQAGRAKISLFDSKGKELAALYSGELRRSARSAEGGSVGQYVRREGEDTVYMISESLSLSVLPEQWIRSEVINVSEERVLAVTQHVDGAQSFILDASAPGTARDYLLRSGEAAQPAAARQVATGLENVRLSDVLKSDDERVQKLNFDHRTTYDLANGQRIVVESALDSETQFYYIRLSAEHAPELAQIASEKYARANEARKIANLPDLTTPTAATAEETAKLHSALTGWVYAVPQYQAEKYRQSLTELLKQPESSASSATPNLTPAN